MFPEEKACERTNLTCQYTMSQWPTFASTVLESPPVKDRHPDLDKWGCDFFCCLLGPRPWYRSLSYMESGATKSKQGFLVSPSALAKFRTAWGQLGLVQYTHLPCSHGHRSWGCGHSPSLWQNTGNVVLFWLMIVQLPVPDQADLLLWAFGGCAKLQWPSVWGVWRCAYMGGRLWVVCGRTMLLTSWALRVCVPSNPGNTP